MKAIFLQSLLHYLANDVDQVKTGFLETCHVHFSFGETWHHENSLKKIFFNGWIKFLF